MIDLVFGVIAASILFSSRFIVSGLISTKTGVAPASRTAFAVEEKVKLGRITSSPAFRSHKRSAISSAVEPLVVSSTFCARKRSSIQALHFLVKAPSPQILWESIASLTYSYSSPTQGGTLKGIILSPLCRNRLFYRHRFCQVSRFIYIESLGHTDIVGKQL